MKLRDVNSSDIITLLKEKCPHTQIIVITGNASEDSVIDLLRVGVFDYITKPVNLDYLEIRLQKAIERKHLLDDNEIYITRLAEQNKMLLSQSQRLEILLDDTARELIQTTEYLRTAVNNLPEGILLVDSSMRIKMANKNITELFELPEDPRETSVFELKGNTELINYLREKIEQNDISKSVHSIDMLNNDRILLFEMVPVLIGTQIENYIIIVKDITIEQRHKSWLEAVMNTLVDGITIIDKERRIIWMNSVAEKWCDEFTSGDSRYCYNWFHCSDSPLPKCPAALTFADGKIHRTTLREVTHSGEERVFDVISGAIMPHQGEVHQVVEIRKDVTIRARMISDLQETMEDLEKLNKQLNEKIEQLSIITQITDTLQSTNNLNEILHIILTAVTAEQGLGFNRAFLLLLDKNGQYLEGKYAIGPSDAEEAGKIWSELSRTKGSLHDVLGSYRIVTADTNMLAKITVERFKIPVSNEKNILIDSLLNHRIFNFTNSLPDRDISDVSMILQTNNIAVVPVHTMTDNLGVLIIDNKITNTAVNDNQLEFLRLITNHAVLQ